MIQGEQVLRIALADDQALVRRGLRALLEALGGIEVVIEAEDGAMLLAALRQQSVDAVLSDIRMPRLSGIDAVRALRARGDDTPAVLLTTFDDAALLQGAVQAGAQGFMLKDADPEELKDALLRIAAGETLFAPISLHGVPPMPIADTAAPAHLTERELAVLRLVAGGYSNKEIGRALGISDGTVKNHITEILYKLNARDRTHAVLRAIGARMM